MMSKPRKKHNSLTAIQIACASELLEAGADLTMLALFGDVSPTSLHERVKTHRSVHAGPEARAKRLREQRVPDSQMSLPLQ